MIKKNLMGRVHRKREQVEKNLVLLCPNIQTKLERSKELVRNWSPRFSSEEMFEVENILLILKSTSSQARRVHMLSNLFGFLERV